MTKAIEANFDGIIGPSHNYGGLSFGNLASAKHKNSTSNPKQAALQGIEKAKKLKSLGMVQGFLPPQERPFLPILRKLGFEGNDKQVFEAASNHSRELIANISAASSMWAANAATISPNMDCADNRLHATPANLHTMAHRAIEANQTKRALRRLLNDETRFKVHDELPHHSFCADEGAANHNRMCGEYGDKGIEIFVYGRDGFENFDAKFPARQTRQTGEIIARNHTLKDEYTIHARQARTAIEAGAFHNDVVAVTNKNVLFYHEFAFENQSQLIDEIKSKAASYFEPIFVEIANNEVPIRDAIKSYLFNTQLIDPKGDNSMTIIAPMECYETPSVKACLERICADNSPIDRVEYVDVRGSMNNGGGPACLRLRIVLDENDIKALGGNFLLENSLDIKLENWVKKHYRDVLNPDDLRDWQIVEEGRTALDELTKILNLGSDFYDFQR